MAFFGSLLAKGVQEMTNKISGIGNLFKTRKSEILAVLTKNNIAIDKSSIKNTAVNIIEGLKKNKNFSQDLAALLSTPGSQYGSNTGIVPPSVQYDGNDPTVIALADSLSTIANAMDTTASQTLADAMKGVDLSTTESPATNSVSSGTDTKKK
jgi:hypothetical protein